MIPHTSVIKETQKVLTEFWAWKLKVSGGGDARTFFSPGTSVCIIDVEISYWYLIIDHIIRQYVLLIND